MVCVCVCVCVCVFVCVVGLRHFLHVGNALDASSRIKVKESFGFPTVSGQTLMDFSLGKTMGPCGQG
ncbi:hypothetical protein ACRRTK_011022 [Alexandromys fortis]